MSNSTLTKLSNASARAVACLGICLTTGILFQANSAEPALNPKLPTVFLVGDSTVNNGTKGLQGWGTAIGDYFDKTKVNVANRARGGRSSRSFIEEGLWDSVLAEMKPGDFVLVQFGHNDGGSLTDEKTAYRASLRSTGEETKEVDDAKTGQKKTVHSFGWYMRKYAADTKAKKATPIVLSLIPRNDWKDGKVLRASDSYGKFAADVAKSEKALFIDLNQIVATHYDEMGQEKVKPLFPMEHTHTSPEGAELNARCVVEGIKGLKDCPLRNYLSAKAKDIPAWSGAK
jgi:lysophospholipase L1-like esterase